MDKPSMDLYGSLGAVADGQWAARWINWTAAEVDTYFSGVVNWGPLGLGQCEELLQGLPPGPKGWLPSTTQLAEFESVIGRFRDDVDRGALPRNPTAAELAAWCDAMNAELPAAFVRALGAPRAAPGATVPQSPIAITLPPWAAPLKAPTAILAAAKSRAKGRPRGASMAYGGVLQAGITEIMECARAGNPQTVKQIAKTLASRPVGEHMTPANIKRRLNGALPVEQAKATARKAARTMQRPSRS